MNWLKNICKKNFNFSQHFDLCKNNLKASWKLIGMLVKRNSKGQTPISKLNVIIELTLIRLRLPINLISILSMWVKTWPKEMKIVMDVRPNSYIRSTPVASFVMSCVTETQVRSLLKGLNDHKSSLDIPNK